MSEEQVKQDPADSYKGKMDSILEHDRNEEMNIHQRIHAVMKDVWYIQKEGSTGQYNTVEHDDVTRKIRPAIVKYGISVHVHDMEIDEPRIVPIEKYNRNTDEHYEEKHFLSQAKLIVQFTNIDNQDDYIRVPTYAMEKDKLPLSVSGKILSYSFKYAVLKTFFLETGDREDTEVLKESETDLNAVWMYNELGEELFGDEWEKKGRKKIYKVTGGMTAEASRAPTELLNEAIKNLYALKKKKEENKDKDIDEIDKEQEKENKNDILGDFQD